MYNIFTNIILTAKGKVCIQAEYDSMNAQKFYASLFEAYNDQLSTQLNATKLRYELAIMKLDDKWGKGFETFLHHWTSNV
jgi:N-formylglutamate amidohydrolase